MADKIDYIEVAIEIAGTASAVARDLGVSRQAIHRWRRQGFVPAVRARQMETLYKVPFAKLLSPTLRRKLLDMAS